MKTIPEKESPSFDPPQVGSGEKDSSHTKSEELNIIFDLRSRDVLGNLGVNAATVGLGKNPTPLGKGTGRGSSSHLSTTHEKE